MFRKCDCITRELQTDAQLHHKLKLFELRDLETSQVINALKGYNAEHLMLSSHATGFAILQSTRA